MPDPIQSPSNACWYPVPEAATAQENDAQMSSTALRAQSAEAPPAKSPTPTGPAAEPRPAASAPDSGAQLLVARHAAAKAPPAPQPSVLEAAWACRSQLERVALAAGSAALATAPTAGASVLLAAGIVAAGNSFDQCATEHEAQQVKTKVNDAAAKECEAEGGTPLLSYRGSVVCTDSK